MRRVLSICVLFSSLIGLAAFVYLRPWETHARGMKAPAAPKLQEMARPTIRSNGTGPAHEPERPARTVRVAAIQMCSEMGRINSNRERMTRLAHQAASLGAQMVVFPECALQGYMEVHANRVWTKDSNDTENPDVGVVALSRSSAQVRHFCEVARERGIYIALPLIEVEANLYYNALVLIDARGRVAAWHRKHSPWAPGDATWMTAGSGQATVALTPFGRVGLMICHDLHTQPLLLRKACAEIVLYAVGWYGPNVENWYRDIFPRRYVEPNGFSVVAANWALRPGEKDWGGAGYSCVIDRNGGVVAMAKTPTDEELVIADLPAGAAVGETVETMEEE